MTLENTTQNLQKIPVADMCEMTIKRFHATTSLETNILQILITINPSKKDFT